MDLAEEFGTVYVNGKRYVIVIN